MPVFLAIDQSTSATKAILFNEKAAVIDQISLAHRQIYPQPGWVEHDAAEIYANTLEALRLHQQLLPLMDALFVESNPVPLKAALQLLGIGTDVVRLPLAPASAATRILLAEALCLAADGTLPGVM